MSETAKEFIKDGRYERRSEWQLTTNGRVAEFYDHSKGKRVFIKEFIKLRYPASTRDTSGAELPTLAAAAERADRFFNRTVQINGKVRQIAHEGGDLVVTTDFFTEGLCIYKVTELVEMVEWSEGDVSRHLKVEDVDVLMLRLAGALQTLHEADVLHCDLKPENVFIVRTREGDHVGKLSDFDDSFLMSSVPGSKDIVCTPEYMSPELGCYKILGGDEPEMPLGPASDVFSLGLIYHEYLTGEAPAFSDDYEQIFAALLDNQPLHLSSKLDPAHRLLLHKMLVTLPYDRMKSCGEVKKEIGDIRRYYNTPYTLTVMNGSKPLTNGRVELWAHFRASGEESVTQHVKLCELRTNAAGQVKLKGLTKDDYTLRMGDVEVPVNWEGSRAGVSATVQIARTRRYALTVLHDGKPLAGKEVTLNHFSEERVLMGSYKARTDDRGVASFENLPDGVWQAAVDKVRQAFRWDDACSHTFHIRTFALTLMQGGSAAGNKQVELVGQTDSGAQTVSVRSDGSGVVRLYNLNTGVRYAIRCDGREIPFDWSEERRATVQLAVRTELSVGVLMDGNRQPVMNALVCVGEMRDGRFVKLAEGRTNASGMAELGRFDEGEYLVGVIQLPTGVTLRQGKVGQAVRVRLSGECKRAAFAAEKKTEGVILDEDIPEDVSRVYSHIVRYSDGGVVLTARRTGAEMPTRADQLALKGLENYM